MKKIIILLIIFIALILGFYFFKTSSKNNLFPFLKNEKALIKDKTFKLIIAKTREEKEIGLSGKESLPQDQGMLFPFEKEGFYSFWVKDMKFSIDIIYINKNRIITIYRNVQPLKKGELPNIYKPEEPADTVLEINGGLSQKYGFDKGNEVAVKN